MTDGQASEPPQGTPGRRALGAMESAVRRVRESAGGTPVQRPPSASAPSETSTGPGPRPEYRPADPVQAGREQAVTRERWLVGSVLVAAVLVVVGAVALALTVTSNESPSSTPSTVAAPGGSRPATTGHGGAGGTNRGGSHTRSTSPGTSPSSTTTTAPPTPGGAPVISALDPASGVAGQGIEIAGANFLSSSGQIVATFNGQVAPTTCPAQSTCTVTVPPGPGAGSVQVVITTSAGSSNPVTFTYS